MKEFFTGDEVIVLEGEHKGQWGIVTGFVQPFEQYSVILPDVDPDKSVWLDAEAIDKTDPDEPDEESEPTFNPPAFGMSDDEFVAHLEFLMGRALGQVPTVGPASAFFGYQEFEELTAEDVLLRLLDKIEQGIAHLAQAHILISRIGVSYRTMIKEITDEN